MGYFERFVSRRYLLNRSNRALVSIITFIAIAGVAVGVAALIIVIGVIEGIDKDIFGRIIEIQPHLKISRADQAPFANWNEILKKVQTLPEVKRAEPIISRQILFEAGNRREAPRMPGQVIGVTTLGKNAIYAVPNKDNGSDIQLLPKDVIIGNALAYQLDVHLGDTVLATTGQMQKTANGWRPRMRNLNVFGIFGTGISEFDSTSAFVSLDTAREVFGIDDAVDFVQVKLKDPFAVGAFKSSLRELLGTDFKVVTWEEENGEFFQALKLEKIGLTTILLLVIIVASFNIVGTLILMVMEKKRQIGILKAIGASERMIRITFLSAGSTIGVLGTAVGVLLGLAGCWLVKNKISLDLSGSAFEHLPVVVNPSSVLLIIISSLAISLLAALFPAVQAARLDPIEALRHE